MSSFGKVELFDTRQEPNENEILLTIKTSWARGKGNTTGSPAIIKQSRKYRK